MKRRTALQTLAAGAAAPAIWAQGRRKPNFIIVLLDDLGCTDLGCYGAKDMKTPNIDALGAAGTKFTNWYSNASVCAPARAALMTGRYPARAGVPTNGATLGEQQLTLPALLKSQQYHTGLIGKCHLGSQRFATPNDRGFDYFYGFHPGCVDFYSHRYYWGEPRVSRRGKWKLVVNGFTAERWPEGRTPLKGEDSIFLSDLETDPGESKNLRRVHPNVVDELATLAQKWKTEMESPLTR